jgi:hypothetical protein
MLRPTLVFVCCGAALLAAGCGGSKQLSQAEFQAKANHICSDLSRREKPDVHSTSRAALDRNISRLDFFKANESILILLTRQLQKHPGDNATAARYDQLVRPFVHDIRQASAAATALGLTDCANGFSGGSSG